MRVITFGEILLRLAAPGYTKLFQNGSMDTSFCGGEVNVAVSLAIFGLDSAFVTKVPNNDVGYAAINSIKYFGVDTDNVIYGDGRMGLYYLEKGASQRPSKVIYDRAQSAIALACKKDFDWDKIFTGAQWFHWTGINPALSDELAEICEIACKEAKRKGLIVSCDLNYRAMLWSSEKAQKTMAPLMKYVDICICNEEDAEKVLGIAPGNNDIQSGKLNKDGYISVAKELSSRYGCKKVAITLRESYSSSRNGWSAMLYDSNEEKAFFSTQYDIQIIDRVGGGDSFTAGLIYAVSTGMQNQEAIEFAVAASCLKHTIEGDFNRTSVDDVKRLLSNGGGGRIQR